MISLLKISVRKHHKRVPTLTDYFNVQPPGTEYGGKTIDKNFLILFYY